MKLLAIDTSSDYLGLAVLEDDIVKISLVNKLNREHASVLISRIDEILALSGVSFAMLDGFVVDIGPGSFTGLRIGIAAVKGFLAGSDKSVKLIKSLELIAHNIPSAHADIAVVLDAKREKFYFCLFREINGVLKPVTEYLLLRLDDIVSKIRRPTIFLGDGLSIIKEPLKKRMGSLIFAAEKEYWYPRPELLGLVGYRRIKKEGFDKKKDLLPFYMYPKECTITQKKHT
ncbi:MAG: tRNA (adenosine(37)-N6)-threonylcarbamoyltransferase complex dimerization subunit type 1 TsaB [Candidatus Omnitrophota bacterium]